MFKNNDAPISLFSFQDIITTLTGIMLLFLLVMALIMIQVNSELQKSSPVYEDIRQARQENEALKAEIAKSEADIASLRRRAQQLQKRDNAQLKMDKFALEKRLREQKRRLETLKKEVALQQSKLRKRKLDSTDTAQTQENLKEIKKEIEKLEKQIEKLWAQRRKVLKEIKEKRRMISITTSGSDNKIPLLIVCSRDGIDLIEQRSKRVIKVARKSPVLPELVSDAMKHIRTFPAARYYYVLLVKPSSTKYYLMLKRNLHEAFTKPEIGIEPILESEECI